MESVIRMCLDAMALQYLAHNDQPCPDFTSCEVPAGILHLPASPHEEGSQDLRQQLIHLSGQQIPTPKQAPHMIPMHPPTNDAIQQQLHSMSMQRLELPDQTSKPSLNDISQPSESVKPSSPSTIAEPCATASHAPHIHPESLESVQAAFSLGLPAKVKEQPAAQLPCLTHANLMQLQSHAADFTDKDRRDWLVSLKFLRSAMQHADWPGDIWSEGALLDMVGRIASNNFGIYSTRQVSKLQHPVTPSKSCTPAAVADQVTSCQSQCSLPPDSALPHSNEQATWSQNQSSLHESVEQQTLPDSLPPKFKARDALRQPCLHEADASSAAVPTKVLPWPLQAETQPPLPPPSQTPVAEGRTPQGSPQTLDRPTDHQPHQAGFPMLLSGKMGSSNDEYLNNKGMKAHGQQLPARQKPAKEDVVGREMYITASFFNHSCEPNCVKHRLLGQQSGIATVTALRDIKASPRSLWNCLHQ